MGCFWSPDALFGRLPGVVRTRVGYAGGSTAAPTYRRLGDHIESLQLDYDPEQISFERLLQHFFEWHTPIRTPWKRQYASALFYHTAEQEQHFFTAKEAAAQRLPAEVHTLLYPYQEFYLAEERHQKYKLQRHPLLLQEFSAMYPQWPDLINSTASARVNGYLYGGGDCRLLLDELPLLGLSAQGQNYLLQTATDAAGQPCLTTKKPHS